MANYSRRHFLKNLAAFGALASTARSVFSLPFNADSSPFEYLVVGDSLIWGQGLNEQDKFYYLTKEWLQDEMFGGARLVNLKVKAHSGAKIALTKAESDTLQKAEIDETEFYPPEVNINFPSIWTQIDAARKEYEAENTSAESVNLVMLTGGITDIKVSNVLDAFGSEDKLRSDIPKYCNEKMSGLLQHTAATFPNAQIVVVGYYPIVSSYTPTSKLFNAILELYDSPRLLKPLINNAASRTYLRTLRKKIIRRSQIWVEGSNTALQAAVDKLNSTHGKQKAIFVKSLLTEENSYAAEKTLLWKMAKKGKTEDDLYNRRKIECQETLDELRRATGLKYRTRMCEIASVGHPNIEGSKVYAEAIKNCLKPFFASNPV